MLTHLAVSSFLEFKSTPIISSGSEFPKSESSSASFSSKSAILTVTY